MQNIFIVPTMQHGCCAKPLVTVLQSEKGKYFFVNTISYQANGS